MYAMRRSIFKFSLAAIFSLIGIAVPILFIAAQSSQKVVPSIVVFKVQGTGTFQAVEQATSKIKVDWVIVGLQPGQHVQLESYVANNWVTLESNLAATGTLDHVAAHPLTFADPVYRLRVLDSRNQPLTEQDTSVPYTSDSTVTPKIVTFQTTATAIRLSELKSGTARLPITWQVNDRTRTSQIVFEQIVNNAPVSVELPRSALWIRSTGSGGVAPIVTTDTTITLQMRVVDILSGATYDKQQIVLSIDTTPPTPAPRPIVAKTPVLLGTTTPTIKVNAFYVNPGTVPRGGKFTVTWDVEGLNAVQIVIVRKDHILYITGLPIAFYNFAQAKGSAQLTLPTEVEFFAYIMLYTPQPFAQNPGPLTSDSVTVAQP